MPEEPESFFRVSELAPEFEPEASSPFLLALSSSDLELPDWLTPGRAVGGTADSVAVFSAASEKSGQDDNRPESVRAAILLFMTETSKRGDITFGRVGQGKVLSTGRVAGRKSPALGRALFIAG